MAQARIPGLSLLVKTDAAIRESHHAVSSVIKTLTRITHRPRLLMEQRLATYRCAFRTLLIALFAALALVWPASYLWRMSYSVVQRA